MNRSDLAGRLRATFLVELEEQIRGINAELLVLEQDSLAEGPLRSLFRSAHTLKGAARAAGFPEVEQVCHSLETLLSKARDGTRPLGVEEFRILFSAADALADGLARLRAGDELADSTLTEVGRSLARSPGATSSGDRAQAGEEVARRGSPGPEPKAADTAPPVPPDSPAPATIPSPAVPAVRQEIASGDGAELRIEPEKLDSLIAAVGQLRTTSSRLNTREADLRDLRQLAQSIADRCIRMVQALRRDAGAGAATELDVLVDDVRRLATTTGRVATEARVSARSVAHHTDELAQQVKALRMRPFADVCEAMPRLVRDLASGSGKEVRLEIEGRHVEADREVWKAVGEALLHLVPNAIDHGLELPETRVAAGKPAAGTIRLEATIRGDRLSVTVSDDGGGLNIPAIRTQMERAGLQVPAADAEVARMMFGARISTRTEATMISGRGVGLDSVRHAIERARGTVEADWLPGGGTRFTIECPITLVTVRVILARVGSQTVAVPTSMIGRILRVHPEEVRRLEDHDVITGDSGPVRLVSLARLLGPPLPDHAFSHAFPVLVLAGGARSAAIAVDELIEDHELLVRPVKRVGDPPPYLAGAAILPAGDVALVLNGVALLEAALEDRKHPRITAAGPAAAAARQTILVVDDSVTTRTLEHGILDAAGYHVLTAADGADAWRLLQEHPCDLIVSDVEMPRMDGYELCEAVRASPRLHSLPIVLVTALQSAGERTRGLEAGADAYLPKASFDQDELLDTIRQLIG